MQHLRRTVSSWQHGEPPLDRRDAIAGAPGLGGDFALGAQAESSTPACPGAPTVFERAAGLPVVLEHLVPRDVRRYAPSASSAILQGGLQGATALTLQSSSLPVGQWLRPELTDFPRADACAHFPGWPRITAAPCNGVELGKPLQVT
jgi:hypothetical protein